MNRQMMIGDMELVRAYALDQSESAFATLVERYVNLVYSAAMRQVQDPHLAEEITQAVFVVLARKAGTFGAHTILPSWLYRTAGFVAADALRTQRRRAHREQEAYMQSLFNEPQKSEGETWLQIAPLLDAAIVGLPEKDRHAIVLRFFQNKSLRETGLALGASEEAAKKRVSRALERLQKFFSRHGIISTTSAIAGAISTNSIQAAPVGLTKAITALGLAQGATASASTLTLIKGALKIMAWTKTQSAIITGVVVLFALGTTTVTVKEITAYWSQGWRESMDVSLLDRVARQAKILPALHSGPKDAKGWVEYHGMLLGHNESVPEIMFAAYNDGRFPAVSRTRMVFSVPVPEGTYDFISNVPQNQQAALQQEIKNEFGLVGRFAEMATNVLVVTLRDPHASGLKPAVSARMENSGRNGIFSFANFPIADLPVLLEDLQPGTPVVNQAGLTGYFDLKWDSRHDSLEKAVRDQLGVALVPGWDRVEFLVIDSTN